MNYGKLTADMIEIMEPFVKSKTVVDLGAGTGYKTRWIVRLGAQHVHAVDKEGACTFNALGITYHDNTLFKDFNKAAPHFDVAFLSWPTNRVLPGLIPLLHKAQTIIYLGCNYGGSACGSKTLYEYLIQRDLLHEVATSRNTMMVLGKPLQVPRFPTFEEQCGMSPSHPIQWFNSRDK